jgi:hypothetical protein
VYNKKFKNDIGMLIRAIKFQNFRDSMFILQKIEDMIHNDFQEKIKSYFPLSFDDWTLTTVEIGQSGESGGGNYGVLFTQRYVNSKLAVL